MYHSNPKQLLAENIRKYRQELGLSQEELAARAGLHRTYISSVERAERNVSLENIFHIAEALGIEPALLIRKSNSGGDA